MNLISIAAPSLLFANSASFANLANFISPKVFAGLLNAVGFAASASIPSKNSLKNYVSFCDFG